MKTIYANKRLALENGMLYQIKGNALSLETTAYFKSVEAAEQFIEGSSLTSFFTEEEHALCIARSGVSSKYVIAFTIETIEGAEVARKFYGNIFEVHAENKRTEKARGTEVVTISLPRTLVAKIMAKKPDGESRSKFLKHAAVARLEAIAANEDRWVSLVEDALNA